MALTFKDKFFIFFEKYKNAEATLREVGPESDRTRKAFEDANQCMLELVKNLEKVDKQT